MREKVNRQRAIQPGARCWGSAFNGVIVFWRRVFAESAE
jgi:hypothetical protein